ncbi:rod-binding protein [Phenylobacterium sp.]|uniref:rod-binding protein n=1 Tax=Phenylobacterium sp. TaxID=1871053 RepID=UPI00301BA52F
MTTPMSPSLVSPALLSPTPAATAQDMARTAKARDAAQTFETQFLSVMFQQMFAGIETDGPFGGGAGEEMFRSLMTDAMAQHTVKAGGIGIADTIQRELLRLQEAD